jgi:predicted class III extradiol MEMO1 family dioxygenase
VRIAIQTRVSITGTSMSGPTTVALLSEMMRLLHRGEFTLRQHANSGELTGLFRPPVTSYVTGYYR